MEYREAARFLLDLRRYRMRPGTDATAELLSHLGDPHEGPEYVQIAGTNGKGSTARMVESILREAGLDVGLYTSPHMDDVRERIRVNDRPIPKAALATCVDAVREYITDRAADGASPTFFETLTALALWHFGREDVDVAVIEVGIGGRLDATSVVEPTASAVTNVSLEHTAVLGDTVPEIARDKTHVAPEDGPFVTGTTGEALDAVLEQAGDAIRVGTGGDVTVDYGGVEGEEASVTIQAGEWGVETRLALLGEHQARNAGIAATLARLVAGAEEATIARGLRSARWPGRFEIMSRKPLVVLDGAHNPAACAAVADTLGEFEYDDLTVVFGAMYDKDHAGMVEALPAPDRALVCRPDVDRAADRDVLARVFEREGVPAVADDEVESALDDALADAAAGDCVLVTGSLYTVREARRRWTRLGIEKRVPSVAAARETLADAHVAPGDVRRVETAGVHRVLKTRVRPRQARLLGAELRSVGGECAVSALADQDEELVDVVMLGTLAQFERLTATLGTRADGLARIAADVRAALSLEGGSTGRGYPWADGTAVMGILNVTPDSFHDGGEYNTTDAAVARAEAMVDAGADILDVGGESTRPGAEPVSVAAERDRVVPVIDRLADLDVAVSVDTRKAAVARPALEAGADMVNDVSGLSDPEMRFVAAERDVPVVIMHSIDAPVVPDKEVAYDDVVEDVLRALRERVLLAERAGLDRSQIVVDPGLGFGKTPAESFELLGRLGEFHALGCPVLVGHSHKSMFGAIDRYPDEGGYATTAATALAVERGADVVRVHDVPQNVAAARAVAAANRSTD